MGTITPLENTAKTGERIIIRSARAEDAPTTVAIKRDVTAEGAYTLVEMDEFSLTPEREINRIKDHTEGEGSLFLVAESEGKVIGILEFANGGLKRTAHSGMLGNIFVEKSWREKGIGKLLTTAALEWATANPLIEKVTLAVFSTNPRAIGLYEKLGFSVEGRCPRDMKLSTGEYIDSVLMYKFVK